MTENLPRYVPKDNFADYLQNYANNLQLDIRHGCTVTAIDHMECGEWRVQTEQGDEWRAKHLIIATGLNRIPQMPTFEGDDHYKGNLFHSIAYKTGGDFADKRVLVIGSGNTGTEICADLVENGAKDVHISIRTPPLIVPRDPFSIPIHVWGVPMSFSPAGIGDRIASIMARIQLGNLACYGLEKAQWAIFKDKRIPTIDVGFVKYLKRGDITIQPDVSAFTPDGVKFKDGTQADYDVVIAATGYQSGLQNVIHLPDVIDE